MSADDAFQLNRVPLSFVERQFRLLRELQLPTQFTPAAPDHLWAAMQHYKKVEHGQLRFILPTRFGHVELVPGINQQQTLAAIEFANHFSV